MSEEEQKKKEASDHEDKHISSSDGKSTTATEILRVIMADKIADGEICMPAENDDGVTISKSQLKKLRKIKKWEETKGLKRKMEKEKKRAKRLKMIEEGITVTKKKRILMNHPDASAVRVALDLSFNKLMTEKDQRKVVKQVLRCYSVNRVSPHPLQLYLTNFDNGNKELFSTFSTGYKTWDVHLVEENHTEKFNSEELVYLTSDSSNILNELDEKKVYVIGGIVDHNAHKGLCFGLAEKAGIGHARLPIDEYIKLEGRKVLPINHVYEILLHFVEHSNWEEAFYHVIPKRKGLSSHQASLPNASENEDSNGMNSERKIIELVDTPEKNNTEAETS